MGTTLPPAARPSLADDTAQLLDALASAWHRGAASTLPELAAGIGWPELRTDRRLRRLVAARLVHEQRKTGRLYPGSKWGRP